ncbi:IS3 family transposase [Rhizobium sp. L1K21]|uniref:IS3 family transposase n=1 Tax=Rhizobium sp. L1K21 TaxID=2954933 RepID=UPI0035933B1B
MSGPETFFKTLKSELIWGAVFHTRRDAGTAIARYVEGFCDTDQRYSSLDDMSPVQFERMAA